MSVPPKPSQSGAITRTSPASGPMLNSQHSSALPPNSPECRSTQAGPGLGGGTGDRSRGTRRDRGRLGQLGDGGFHSVADDVAPASRVIFEDTPEEIHQVGCVHS